LRKIQSPRLRKAASTSRRGTQDGARTDKPCASTRKPMLRLRLRTNA